MFGEAKKLQLIEEILKVEDEAILEEMQSVLNKSKLRAVGGLRQYSGIWTSAEADEIQRVIDESCEQINPDDWK